MSEFAIVLLFLFVSVGGGLLLWAAVDSEKQKRRVMDRESAEQVARRDTDESRTSDDARGTEGAKKTDDRWGTADEWGRTEE